METANKYFFRDMGVMLGRSMRHIIRSLDTIITVTLTPIAMMLLFVYVFGGAIHTGTDNYVNYLLPGILLMAIASGIAYTAIRLFYDIQRGIFERFHSTPIARSAALWGACADFTGIQCHFGCGHHTRRNTDGLPLVGGHIVMAGCNRYTRAVYAGTHLDRGDCRIIRQIGGRSRCLFLPARLPAVYQFGLRAHRIDAAGRPCFCRKPAGDVNSGSYPRTTVRSAGRQ